MSFAWWTGKVQGIDHVYEALRRWAVREGRAGDRPALCRDLARMAELYGILTGTAGEHPDAKVERELRHLRAMGIHIHRPLTLRFLSDATGSGNGRTRKDSCRDCDMDHSFVARGPADSRVE